ncbi:3'-5' exonuclease [Variovorax paradoxus]
MSSTLTVRTIHQAKGMEWDYIFVIGVTGGVPPDTQSQKSNWTRNAGYRI